MAGKSATYPISLIPCSSLLNSQCASFPPKISIQHRNSLKKSNLKFHSISFSTNLMNQTFFNSNQIKTVKSNKNGISVTCQKNVGDRTPPTADSGPLVKLAWYASEAFGKVVSNFRKDQIKSNQEKEEDYEQITREFAVEALRKDYDRSYFVTGEMSMGIYENNCEFADPFVSFRGKDRFKQNVSNLGSFMEEVNLKILDWKEDEEKITTKWRFSCVLGLPWRPILAASGGTDHYFDPNSGKIYKHVERWDISPADGLRQLVKPNPKLKRKKSTN